MKHSVNCSGHLDWNPDDQQHQFLCPVFLQQELIVSGWKKRGCKLLPEVSDFREVFVVHGSFFAHDTSVCACAWRSVRGYVPWSYIVSTCTCACTLHVDMRTVHCMFMSAYLNVRAPYFLTLHPGVCVKNSTTASFIKKKEFPFY